jgi:hypothetical protein
VFEFAFDTGGIDAAVSRQMSYFRKVLPQKAIGVLIRSSPGRTATVAEVHRGSGGGGDFEKSRHLAALIPAIGCSNPAG